MHKDKIAIMFLWVGLGWMTQVQAQTPSLFLDQAKLGLVNKQISTMKSIVLRLEKETQMARDKNDVIRVNCLIIKLNLTRSLLKACERSFPILERAFSKKDSETSRLYLAKTESYFYSAREVEKSIYEC
jgi:hypothetical protein